MFKPSAGWKRKEIDGCWSEDVDVSGWRLTDAAEEWRREKKRRRSFTMLTWFSCCLRRAVDGVGVGGGLGGCSITRQTGWGGWGGWGSGLLAGGHRRAGLGADVDQTLAGLEAR